MATQAENIFSPVRSGRVSQGIVDQIRLLIRQGQLEPGDRLPSEREMVERFEVSRVTVREALRVLEAGGLISIKVGAHGGAFVTNPDTTTLGNGLADLMLLSELTAANVTEARSVVELGILALVAQRATSDDLDELEQLCRDGKQALAEGRYSMEMSAAFHTRLAACTHNPAVEMLVRSFHGPMLMSLKEANVAEPLMGHRGASEHLELVRALRKKDVDGAVRIMRRHIGRTATRVARTAAATAG